jgi:capsular polysaccharide transport system ATP-binding protein
MIHLCGVSKHAIDEINGARFLLRDVTISLPRGSRVALLGQDRPALTTLLHLLAGSEVPDEGRIIAYRLRRSPIINSGSWAGSSLAMRLTGLENINFFARMNGVDPTHLLAVVESACRLGRLLRVPVREYDRTTRRAFEVALIAALPYDCYLADGLNEFEPRLLWQLIHAANGRRAGLIFTTKNMTQAAKLAQVGAVVGDGSIRVYPRVARAIADHEQGRQ